MMKNALHCMKKFAILGHVKMLSNAANCRQCQQIFSGQPDLEVILMIALELPANYYEKVQIRVSNKWCALVATYQTLCLQLVPWYRMPLYWSIQEGLYTHLERSSCDQQERASFA